MPERRCKCECGPLIEYVAVFFSAVNIVNSGMEYGWTSAAFPVLLIAQGNATQPLLTSGQGVMVATLPQPATVLGALFAAYFSTIIGRRSLILFSCVPFMIHWLMIAFTREYYYLYTARILSGIASGIALSSIPIYTGEICSPKLRGLLCGMTAMCITLGVFLMNLMHLFFTLTTAAYISSAFPLASFIGLLFMPESPYYLLLHNKNKKALRSIEMLRGHKDVEFDYKRVLVAVDEHKTHKSEGLRSILSLPVNRRSLLIFAIMRVGQPLSGLTTLIYYSSIILGTEDAILDVKYSTVIFTTSLMLAVFVGVTLVDRVGRRPLLLLSLFGAFFSLLTLAIYFSLKNNKVDISKCKNLPLITMVITVLFYGIGLQHVPFVMQGEIFSAGVKPYAVFLGLLTFSIFAFLCSKYFQALNDQNSAHYAFYTFAFFCAITFTLVYFLVPETKKLHLDEVQLMITQRKRNFRTVNTPTSHPAGGNTSNDPADKPQRTSFFAGHTSSDQPEKNVKKK